MNTFIRILVNNYRKWDFLIFAVLTALAVLTGNTSVFYVIYFFWWNELVRILVDQTFGKRNPNFIRTKSNTPAPLLGSLFLLGIYFVFIVVFFGFIANWGNKELLFTNLEVLLFQNWFFNANVLFILIERMYLHHKKQPIEAIGGHFTPNMIVLHISIILGAILLFFVVKTNPETFTPDNLWGTFVIISPFILLKMLVEYYHSSAKK